MRKVGVVVDHAEREKLIWGELERVAGDQGLEVIDPGGKLEEVLFLVERPTVVPGLFAHHHLALPPEVLVTAMQSHQRYFPLVDETGMLSNHFLYVSNGDPAWTKQITAGNERVLQGRIEDAEFSFEKDKVMGLEAMAAQLDKIVFHVKAGTMRDKTERLGVLVRLSGRADPACRTRPGSALSKPPGWPKPTRCRSWCASSPTWKGSWARSTRSWKGIIPRSPRLSASSSCPTRPAALRRRPSPALCWQRPRRWTTSSRRSPAANLRRAPRTPTACAAPPPAWWP